MTRRGALALLAAGPLANAAPQILGLRRATYRVSNLDRARAYWTGILGLPEVAGVRGETLFQVNERQFIGLIPGWDGKSDRFAGFAFEASAACGTTLDPDGHRFHCETREQRLPLRKSNRISDWMTHLGITVADEAKAMAFYRDQHGFREIWRGGRDDQTTNWINMALPGDSGDYVEFMLIREPPPLAQLGTLHHICLHTDDIQKTWAELKRRGIPDEERFRPRIGRNKRWLLNTWDPDGTRVEFMEPRQAA
jgi:catechol 2,3-dioxygenase-like lactoylglutathione lyase family enzyme